MTADFLKNFIKELTTEAQLQGFKPTKKSFYDICGFYDYDFFAKNVKMLKTDKFAQITYKLMFLSDLFYIKEETRFYHPKEKLFDDFVLDFVGADKTLLNEEFGPFTNEIVEVDFIEELDSTNGYYYLFDRIYSLEPKNFYMYWALSHFICKSCIKFDDTFLVEVGFAGDEMISYALEKRIAYTQDMMDHITKSLNERYGEDFNDRFSKF